MSKISSKNQITIPVDVLREAGIKPGDELKIHTIGPGRIEVERGEDVISRLAGSMTGVWPPNWQQEARGCDK